jgi:hypothetical protein
MLETWVSAPLRVRRRQMMHGPPNLKKDGATRSGEDYVIVRKDKNYVIVSNDGPLCVPKTYTRT